MGTLGNNNAKLCSTRKHFFAFFLILFSLFSHFFFLKKQFSSFGIFLLRCQGHWMYSLFSLFFSFLFSLSSAITVISHDQSAVRVTIKRIQRSDNPFAISRHSRTTSVDVNGTIRTSFPSWQFLDSKEQKRNTKYLIVSKKYPIVSSNVRGLSLCWERKDRMRSKLLEIHIHFSRGK